jgi:hypothetical protein
VRSDDFLLLGMNSFLVAIWSFKPNAQEHSMTISHQISQLNEDHHYFSSNPVSLLVELSVNRRLKYQDC